MTKKRGVEIFGRVFPLNMPIIIQGVAFRLRKATNKDIVLRPFGVFPQQEGQTADDESSIASGDGGDSGGSGEVRGEVVADGTATDGDLQERS